MITLSQILTSIPPLESLRALWLAFPPELGPALEAAQSDQPNVRAQPITLLDGRIALCADLLSEIHPGGIFAIPFSRLAPGNFPLVEVLDDHSFRALLPA